MYSKGNINIFLSHVKIKKKGLTPEKVILYEHEQLKANTEMCVDVNNIFS